MHFKAVPIKEVNCILTTFNHSKLAHNKNGTITVRGNTNGKITITGLNNCSHVQQKFIYMETCSDCVLTGRQVISEKKNILRAVDYLLHYFKVHARICHVIFSFVGRVAQSV
jgi:hypothetical protein